MENLVQTIAFIVQAVAAVAICVLTGATVNANKDLVKITKKVFEENAKLTRVTEQLFEAQDRPFVFARLELIYTAHVATDLCLKIENVGTGAAYDINLGRLEGATVPDYFIFKAPIQALPPNRPITIILGDLNQNLGIRGRIRISYKNSRGDDLDSRVDELDAQIFK